MGIVKAGNGKSEKKITQDDKVTGRKHRKEKNAREKRMETSEESKRSGCKSKRACFRKEKERERKRGEGAAVDGRGTK